MTAQESVRAPEAAPAVPRTGGSARRRWVRRLTPWAFLVLPLTFLITFTYLPVVNMVGYSFTSWNGLNPEKDFVGVDNYVEIFTRPQLFGVFTTSLYYLAGSVVQLTLALYFATILSFDVRFKNVFKGILFFPFMINAVAIGLIFLFFFRPGGTLDSVLALFGQEDASQQWLGNRSLNNFSLAGASVWRFMGLNFVLFLGAIQSIPAQLYEAASIDGASRWQQFRYIIAPGIRPILGLSFILAISGSLSVFEIPYIMTGGSNATTTFVIQTVDTAFKFHKVGLASAMAVVLLVIVLIFTWVQRRLVPDEEVNLV